MQPSIGMGEKERGTRKKKRKRRKTEDTGITVAGVE
jgi:hypothetical protein